MLSQINPLFKWTGSKRKMLKKYSPVFKGLDFKNFVDLCGGTGITSVWIHKNFPHAKITLNEINVDIFGIYKEIKDNYDSFISSVDSYEKDYLKRVGKQERKEMYLSLREQFHNNYYTLSIEDRVPLLYFLMCTNFNGIWQAKASTGLYYTPFGNGGEVGGVYNRKAMFDFKEMVDCATLSCGSYEKVEINDESLVFADPPYISSHTRYDDRGSFDDLMQVEMAKFLIRQGQAGNLFAFCNKDHEIFREAFKGFTFEEFDVKYTASSKDTSGAKAKEILVHNFRRNDE